ncbi:ribosomal protein S18-alanine N-acetyltransferase [Streptomyces nanshensis]|uniref:Ribosomal-protein-alanine acetyltransferase n=1 Tax=Streptomyces nanshensis TaxID=518642 RepID=A0A1E7L700_9ACTN|nr:ribosomal protein S18-alanine N-acetyltransferase [Streptomyces nanshensis]OEV11976.1 ribosomal-protein-alanine acetyltransferase [Streptomyces nanshensis]
MRWWDIEHVLGLERVLFPEDAWSAGLFWSELAHARGPGATRRYLVAEAAGPDAAAPAPAADPAVRPANAPDFGGGWDGLVGYGGLAAVGGTGDIQTIGVLPARRGTGLGSRLLGELLAAAVEFGCHEVMLEVRVDNAPAQRLYERFGFTKIGLRRGYYQPGNVDALVMRLDDPATLRSAPPGSSPTSSGTPSPPPPQGTKTHG